MSPIFQTIAAAMTALPAGEETVDAASRLIRRLRSFDRRMLRVLLQLIEYAPLASTHRRRFSRLAPDQQETFLRSWMTSRMLQKRQAAGSLRALAMLATYGDERSWKETGYDGPWLGRKTVAVLPAPEIHSGRPGNNGPLPAGITSARSVDRDLMIRAQVCVIGTGAGGAAAIARLAAQGLDVVGLESGPYLTADDMTQREHEMLPLLYQEAGLRSTVDQGIGILQGHGIGGSTLHNTGLIYEPPEGIIDRWRNEHGFALDPQAMNAYVREAVQTLNASPIPEDQVNANNQALRRGARALGWRYRLAMHNRAPCSACGYCMLGCAYNRKYNASLTYIPDAVRDGARILSDAAVTRIEGPEGRRRVICRLPGGRRAVIEAPCVVLAAGALDSPVLLQRSKLGNRHTGRHLRMHPAAQVSAHFDEPVTAWRGLPQSIVVEEFADFYRDGYGGWLFIAGAANQPALSAVLTPGIGKVHLDRMKTLAHRASASVLLHDETTGRVTSDRKGRPVTSYWPQGTDLDDLRRGIASLAHLYLAAGARTVYLPFASGITATSEQEIDAAMKAISLKPHLVGLNSVHPQGSLPLGADRRASAVDPQGQVWGAPGIFVADASIFPTSIGVPPQVTIMALATSIADFVGQHV